MNPAPYVDSVLPVEARVRLACTDGPGLKVSPETAILSVDVTNTGEDAGDEVVQFYVRDTLSRRVTRPVKMLKGFQRVTLQPGDCQTVKFPVGPDQLPFLDESMNGTVEPGQFELMVGGNSKTMLSIVLEVKGQ